jgi:hypothetical protein
MSAPPSSPRPANASQLGALGLAFGLTTTAAPVLFGPGYKETPIKLKVDGNDAVTLSNLSVVALYRHAMKVATGGKVMFMPPVCFVWRIANGIYWGARS